MGDLSSISQNAEIRQQLYGGEISDYYRNPSKEIKDDNKELGDIYAKMRRKFKSSNFNTSNNLDNKLK